MIYLLVIFLFINSAFAQQENTTNQRIDYKANLSNIQIGKPFSVEYTMPADVLRIIDIDSNITAMGDTDIEIKNITAKSIDLEVTSFCVTNYPMPSLLLTVIETNGDSNL